MSDCAACHASNPGLCETHAEALRRILGRLPAHLHPERLRLELLDLKDRLATLADQWEADPHSDLTQRACAELLRLQIAGAH